jgi:PEP-CTERM motif
VDLRNNWQLDYNTAPLNTQYDFYSTLFHEFTHALGFYSSISQNGTPSYEDQLSWTKFDSFIVDKNGDRVINPSDYALNPAAWEGSTGGASPAEGLFFDGPNAMAANGGQPVGLYTPETWMQGTSVSHLDDDNPAFAHMIMAAATPTGPTERDFSPVEVGILTDLGYSVTVVPEPETHAMFLAGLGVLGWITRHRRQGEIATSN